MQTPTTLDTITTRDGLVTRTTEIYIDDGELFVRTSHDTDGPVDLVHIHANERIRLACAMLRAEGMLRPVPIVRVPVRLARDIVSVGFA